MSDLKFIKQIEKELNIKLEKLDEISWTSKGYTLNQNGQVIGLGLCDCKIVNLNRIISPLKELTSLTQLYLPSNQLSDISPLKELINLKKLWLLQNNIQILTPLEGLINLNEISIGQNQLNDISSLKNLKELVRIDLQDNQLSNILPLKDLKNLTKLDLENNNISDISALRDLKKLNRLELQKNPITELSPWITDFNMDIQWNERGYNERYISFYNNPLKTPPPEIVEQGKEAIKNYFAQLEEQQEDYLFEAKMLIVGEPGAGKTTLACKIENSDRVLPKEGETTKGIDVKQYYFPLLILQRNLLLEKSIVWV
jgi:hypothetical protein